MAHPYTKRRKGERYVRVYLHEQALIKATVGAATSGTSIQDWLEEAVAEKVCRDRIPERLAGNEPLFPSTEEIAAN